MTEPWDTENIIRAFLSQMQSSSVSTIQKTPGVCGGNARIRNTRIPVWTLVSFRQMEMSDEPLLEYYPDLTPSDLDAAWRYYEGNKAEIDGAIAAQDEDEDGDG